MVTRSERLKDGLGRALGREKPEPGGVGNRRQSDLGKGRDVGCHRRAALPAGSDFGRDARDTFLALAKKTCAKFGISCWSYLGARLNVPGAAVPPLPSPDRHDFAQRSLRPLPCSAAGPCSRAARTVPTRDRPPGFAPEASMRDARRHKKISV
jgi:hypothetical protein